MTAKTTTEVPADSTPNDVQTAIDAGTALAKPTDLVEGQQYGFVVPAGGSLEHLDLDLDKYRPAPRRKVGTTVVSDVASFVHYWNKHSDTGSEVYARAAQGSITAVLNAHNDDSPRWGDHRLVLQLTHSQAWREWLTADRQSMSQTTFAEFIEDHLADIREPSGGELLELAQTFQATTKVSFQSGSRLASGQRQLTYVEEVDAKAGHKGSLTIPERFTLGLEVFEDSGQADAVQARLRYRINGGDLMMSFHLDRPADVARKAFDAVREQTEGAISQAILLGNPA